MEAVQRSSFLGRLSSCLQESLSLMIMRGELELVEQSNVQDDVAGRQQVS
jgi:hypothetical protein